MALTSFNIDPAIQEEMQQVLAEDPVEYPSMGNFINRAIRDKLKSIKSGSVVSDGTNPKTTE